MVTSTYLITAVRVYKRTFINALHICYCNFFDIPHEEKCYLDDVHIDLVFKCKEL